MAILKGFGFKGIAANDLGKTGGPVGRRKGERFHLVKTDPSPSFGDLPGGFTPCQATPNDDDGFHGLF